MTTGKIVWQKHWPESCYAGSTTTKGNIVFIGRSDGRLLAYNATNGNPLWSFQTGAGANDAPTIFEHNGTEYVASTPAATRSPPRRTATTSGSSRLDGSSSQVAAPGAGAGVEHAGEPEDAAEDGRRSGAANRDRGGGQGRLRGQLRHVPRRERARAATAGPT